MSSSSRQEINYSSVEEDNASTIISKKEEYPLDSRRWVILFCLCTVGGINSAQQMNFASVTQASKAQLHLDDSGFDWLVSIFYLFTAVFAFVGLSLFERFGLRFVLLLASILNSLGAVLKLIVVRWYPGYWALFLAQSVAALSQPLYLPLAPTLAASWFPDDQRAAATAVAALCTAAGAAIGMAYAPFMVTGDGSIELFIKYLSIQTAFALFETIVNIFFVKEQPEHAPSASAALRRQEVGTHHHTSMCTRMKEMLKEIATNFSERNRAILLFGGGLSLGTFYSVPGSLCQIFSVWGIDNGLCAIICGALVFVGLIEGAVAGYYADKTKRYKLILLISCFMGVVGTAVSGITIMFEAPHVVIAVTVVFGVAPLVAAFGVIMDAAAEETFPLDEILSSSAIAVVGCGLAFALMNAIPAVLDAGTHPKMMTMVVWGGFVLLMLIGSTCLCLWEPQLPRTKFELSRRQKTPSTTSGDENEQDQDESEPTKKRDWVVIETSSSSPALNDDDDRDGEPSSGAAVASPRNNTNASESSPLLQ